MYNEGNAGNPQVYYEHPLRDNYFTLYNNTRATNVKVPGKTYTQIYGIVADRSGNFYYGQENLGASICKIGTNGLFSLYGNTWGNIGNLTCGLVIDNSDNIHFFKMANGKNVIKLSTATFAPGQISTGTATIPTWNTYNNLTGINVNDIIVATCTNSSKTTLYLFHSTGKIISWSFGTTVVNGISADGNNTMVNGDSLLQSQFFSPSDSNTRTTFPKMVIDGSDNFYICQNNCIRRAQNITGAVRLIAGSVNGTPTTARRTEGASFDPSGVACIESILLSTQVDSNNNLYIMDKDPSSICRLKRIVDPTNARSLRQMTILRNFTPDFYVQDMFIKDDLVYIAQVYGIVKYTLNSLTTDIASQIRLLGTTRDELISAGFSKSNIFTALKSIKVAGNYELSALKAQLFTPLELNRAGFTATQFKAAGFTFDEAYDAGFYKTELSEAGYTFTEDYTEILYTNATFGTAVAQWFNLSTKPQLTNSTHIRNWKLKNVTSMYEAFANRTTFNEDISRWDMSNVTNTERFFYFNTQFNQDIGLWNTSRLQYPGAMFFGCSAFNQDIGAWNTTSVIQTSEMFKSATAFNQDIGRWDMSNNLYMHYMFNGATKFNQDIGGWKTSRVTQMQNMFQGATEFDQNLGRWNVLSVDNFSNMFNGATVMKSRYNGLPDTPSRANFNGFFPSVS